MTLKVEANNWFLQFDPDMVKLNKLSTKVIISGTVEGDYCVFGYQKRGAEYQDLRVPSPVGQLGEDSKFFEEIYSVFSRLK